jgi:hypothetical protein
MIMNKKHFFLSITLLTVLFSMGILSIFGQSGGFASKVKAAIERFCPPGDGGTEGGVKTIEAMISLLDRWSTSVATQ